MNTLEQVNKLKIENFDKEVLREYDIRGVVGNNINQNTAYTIGRTFAYTVINRLKSCLLYTSPSPRDQRGSRMPSSA